jgi:hypothetical protein
MFGRNWKLFKGADRTMAKQPVKILNGDPYYQWSRGEFPFDRAKACNACVTQHADYLCEKKSHVALHRAAIKLTKPWGRIFPLTEEQAQAILKLRRKFFRLFAAN